MTTLNHGSFSLNFGFITLTGNLTDEDRQCAWEFYVELSTRVAVTGKRDDPDCKNFEGELYVESLDSLYSFFKESRKIMRKFPVGRILANNNNHLGALINRALNDVIRRFLERWHVAYRYWWENESNKLVPPIERQRLFPEHEKFINEWTDVRWLMRRLAEEIIKVYRLIPA